MAVFGYADFDSGIDPSLTLTSGLVIDGEVYVRSMDTPFGPYPFPHEMRHGVWSVGKTAAGMLTLLRMAEKYGISRADTDAFGLQSQERAARAIAEGRFDSQIIALEAPEVDQNFDKTGNTLEVTTDEVPRDTSLEALAELKPVAREDGVHTAGTSSQIADGAAAVRLDAILLHGGNIRDGGRRWLNGRAEWTGARC